MCSLWKTFPSKSPELSTDEIHTVVNDLVHGLHVRKIRLSSLEPLMRDDIFEIIAHIRALGSECVLLSNGMGIDREKARDLVLSSPNVVKLSVDGVGEVHDRVRGVEGAFGSLLESVENIKAAKADLGSRLPELHAAATISSLNYFQLSEIHRLAKEIGLDYFEFGLVMEVLEDVCQATRYLGRNVASPQFTPQKESLKLGPEELRAIRLTAETILNEGKERTTLGSVLHPLSRAARGLGSHNFCPYQSHLFVDPDGNIIPCSFLLGVVFGNVRERPVSEIWDNAEHQAFRSFQRARGLPICREVCADVGSICFGSVRSQIRTGLESFLKPVFSILHR
jgi:radical SAM protein with 4Fe4S-binding SPASM domain